MLIMGVDHIRVQAIQHMFEASLDASIREGLRSESFVNLALNQKDDTAKPAGLVEREELRFMYEQFVRLIRRNAYAEFQMIVKQRNLNEYFVEQERACAELELFDNRRKTSGPAKFSEIQLAKVPEAVDLDVDAIDILHRMQQNAQVAALKDAVCTHRGALEREQMECENLKGQLQELITRLETRCSSIEQSARGHE